MQMTNNLKGNEGTTVDILCADKPFSTQAKCKSLLGHAQHEVRYKLIIDRVDYKINNIVTCTFLCSGDNQLQTVPGNKYVTQFAKRYLFHT